MFITGCWYACTTIISVKQFLMWQKNRHSATLTSTSSSSGFIACFWQMKKSTVLKEKAAEKVNT